MCEVTMTPGAVRGLELESHPDERESHRWALMHFELPESSRAIRGLEVRFARPFQVDDPIEIWQPARGPDPADPDNAVALELPRDLEPGEAVDTTLAFDREATTYRVAIRVVDDCGEESAWQTAEVTTTEIHFTTVSPCFVATAAYGTPMAREIRSLRRFRDRHLLNNTLGRAFVDAYYAIGPHLADAIREHEDARALVRMALSPLVSLARTLDGD